MPRTWRHTSITPFADKTWLRCLDTPPAANYTPWLPKRSAGGCPRDPKRPQTSLEEHPNYPQRAPLGSVSIHQQTAGVRKIEHWPGGIPWTKTHGGDAPGEARSPDGTHSRREWLTPIGRYGLSGSPWQSAGIETRPRMRPACPTPKR
jgi:hypothetical protein